MPQANSRDLALATLLELHAAMIRDSTDATVRQLLTDSLLRQVLDEAWRGQFDDDPTTTQRAIRRLVDDAFDASDLGELGQ